MTDNSVHVLLVDDEPAIAQLLAQALGNYRVSVAHDAKTARALLLSDPPDVMLLDIMLPGEDGLAMLADIHPRYPDMPIIVLTAFATTERVIEALRNGAYDFIQKPCRLKVLRTSIERALAHRRQTQQKAEDIEAIRQHSADVLARHRQQVAQQNLDVVHELAQGILHEINNPLSAMRLSLELLNLTQDMDERHANRLKAIAAAVDRIKGTMDSLRLLVLPEEDAVPIAVEALVREAARVLHEDSGVETECRVNVSLPSGLPPVMVKPEQMERVITNVMLNAVEAMTRAAVTPCVVDVSAYQDRQMVCLALHNRGTHISAEELGEIFSPQHTTKVTEGRAHGLGLGLFLARDVVEASGGWITVDSQAGYGVTVTIALPVAEKEAKPDASPE